MRLTRISLAFVTLAALAAGTRATAQRPRASTHEPDLILTGAKVFTADPAHPWAQAVAIRGDRIVAVGTSAEIERLAGTHTRRIALGGRVVVPGFNDAHDHIGNGEIGVGFVAGTGPVPDPEVAEVLDSVRAIAARTPAGTWLHAMVGERLLADSAHMRAPLDAAAPRHRVMLQAWTGHDLFLNTAALRALGIREDARDPIGGHYGRDAAGRLDGHLNEYAAWSAERRLYSSLPDTAIAGAFRRYAADAVRLGITSVQDMNGYLDPATTTRVLRGLDLPIRVRVIPYPMTDVGGALGGEWNGVPRHLGPRTTVSGVKWILDGTPIDRRTLMRADYADAPGWRGALEFPVDSVRAMLRRALATREPLHLHVTGDSSVRVVLSLMQALAPDSAWRTVRVRFEHGDMLSGELLPVARRLGVVVVQNPTHFALDPALFARRLGHVPEHLMDVRAIVDAGVPLAIGSDGPRSPGLNIMFAVTHPLHPASALTREQAVTAYTRGSAYAERAEREKGSLAPGMLADIAVLSQDVFTVPIAALPATTNVLTIVGGRIVWDALEATPVPAPPANSPRAEWNASQKPFLIAPNTWFVGTHGLSAILITSPQGHVLIDGALPESAPLIERNIRALGFRAEDVKVIVNSHDHYDHAGGIAELQRASGAEVRVMAPSAQVLEQGRSGTNDPQYGVLPDFPKVANVHVIADGDTVRVGPLALVAHATPGHTPGGTSWSWRACESGRCVDVVYADSQTPVSADGFLYSSNTTYPAALADFARGLATIESLPCDILLTPHPDASGLWERVAKRDAGDARALEDRTACRRFVASARERIAKRVADEKKREAERARARIG